MLTEPLRSINHQLLTPLCFLPLLASLIPPSYDKGSGTALPDSLAFAAGLASTLALLGVTAATLGKTYGAIGPGLPLAVAALAIIMVRPRHHALLSLSLATIMGAVPPAPFLYRDVSRPPLSPF